MPSFSSKKKFVIGKNYSELSLNEEKKALVKLLAEMEKDEKYEFCELIRMRLETIKSEASQSGS